MEETAQMITESTKQTFNFLTKISNYIFSLDFLFKVLSVALTLFVMAIAYKLIRKSLQKGLTKRLDQQQIFIVKKVLKYIYYGCIVLYIASLFGVKLSALLGAAGIAGVAIGFAAQTSISNIISGVFLLGENAVRIGDYITVDNISGTVQSVDLLSVKIKTPDNQIVRIPNETIIKANLINTTYNENRRMTLPISVSYDTDNLETVKNTLLEIADKNEHILKDPPPSVNFDKFGESSVDLTLCVWFDKNDFWATKNSLAPKIFEVFKQKNIEIPYKQLDVKIKNPEK